jgi:hypothetical protein
MTARKRGRPASAATIERRRIAELLSNLPAHAKFKSDETAREIQNLLENLEAAERQILRQYRTSATIPKSHAYEMASLGDESLRGFESEIIARDQQYQMESERARSRGGQARGDGPTSRAKRLAEINTDLIQKVDSGEMSSREAARRIHKRWQKRGVPDLPQPSQKTLERDVRRVVNKK